MHVADGETEHVPAAHFFRDEPELDAWERVALSACAGRVLDVGAGAGSHALLLERRGHPVVALDVCREAVAVMQRRGVTDARVGTLADVDDPLYDTLLLLMHGVGIVGDVAGLAWFLADAHRLLAAGGRIVLDSRAPADEQDAESIELWMEWDGVRGARFRWLFLGERTLTQVASRVGWSVKVLHRAPDGRYVAVLTRQG